MGKQGWGVRMERRKWDYVPVVLEEPVRRGEGRGGE